MLFTNYAVYGTYEGIAMQLAIVASGLIAYTSVAQINLQIAAA